MLFRSGAALHPLQARLAAARRDEAAASAREALTASAGHGLAFGILGGFRAIVADVLWVRMYTLWQTHEPPPVEALLKLVTTVDPRPLYFWLNGARILAFDMPSWRINAAGGYDAVPVAEQRQIDAEQARLALTRIDEAEIGRAHV